MGLSSIEQNVFRRVFGLARIAEEKYGDQPWRGQHIDE
jgi:hypothetical protein